MYKGQLVLSGVYVYAIEIVYPDGEVEAITGDVTVIR